MRREHVTLNVRNTDEDDGGPPEVAIAVDDQVDLLGKRLVTADGDPLEADQVDAVFRFRTPVDVEDATGVFSLSNRITGEYVLEANADAAAVLDLVGTAREDGADGRYRIDVCRDGDRVATYEKGTLLVYDADGDLLRRHSLIPSGVEL